MALPNTLELSQNGSKVVPYGLFVTHEFITEAEETELITWLDTQPWGADLSRRTQHYGYKYNYSGGALQPAPAMSGPLLSLSNKLAALGYPMEQCIVNEYFRDQGIAPHVDRNLFGPIIMGISLGAECIMQFTRGNEGQRPLKGDNSLSPFNPSGIFNEHYDCLLPRRSLLMLSGPARNDWKHGISKNVTYTDSSGIKHTKPTDYRRISCTFRTINRT